MKDADYQVAIDEVIRLRRLRPRPGSREHQRLEVLRMNIRLHQAERGGASAPSEPEVDGYLALLKKVLTESVGMAAVSGLLAITQRGGL